MHTEYCTPSTCKPAVVSLSTMFDWTIKLKLMNYIEFVICSNNTQFLSNWMPTNVVHNIDDWTMFMYVYVRVCSFFHLPSPHTIIPVIFIQASEYWMHIDCIKWKTNLSYGTVHRVPAHFIIFIRLSFFIFCLSQTHFHSIISLSVKIIIEIISFFTMSTYAPFDFTVTKCRTLTSNQTHVRK